MSTVKKIFSARNIFIFLLTLGCLLAAWWTFLDIRALYRGNERSQLREALQHRPAEISDIETWMTFDYVNVIFKLPPNYLRDNLHITDSRYPNIQIGRYARSRQTDQKQLLKQIQEAVTRYRSGS